MSLKAEDETRVRWSEQACRMARPGPGIITEQGKRDTPLAQRPAGVPTQRAAVAVPLSGCPATHVKLPDPAS